MALTVPVHTFLVTVFFVPTRVPNFLRFFFRDIAERDVGQGIDREEGRERAQREAGAQKVSPGDRRTHGPSLHIY